MSDVSKWDVWNESGGPKYPHEKVIQFCFRRFAVAERGGIRALDLGCGGGANTLFLAKEGFDVTALDASPVGVQTTLKRLEAAELRARVEVQDLATLGLAEQALDLVICVGVLDSAGIVATRSALPTVARAMSSRGVGLFLFASDRDFRLRGENPLGLRGYTEPEVEALFSCFSRHWRDRYITTYEGGKYEQNDWLVTVER